MSQSKSALLSGVSKVVHGQLASPGPASKSRKLRIAFIDIETAPILIWAWQVYEANALHIEKDWHVLSFSVKYLGEKKVYTYGLCDFPNYRKDLDSDKAICEKLWEVLNNADVVIAHNGDRFDLPKINARFIINGLTPPSPYVQLDTKKFAKGCFEFTNNKLEYLAKSLGAPGKLGNSGIKLWLGCMMGDMGYWAEMKRYNRQDVLALEGIYKKMLPWSRKYANMNVLTGDVNGCPRCGSHNLQSRGFSLSNSGRRHKYQCLDCGGWATGKFEGTKGLIH